MEFNEIMLQEVRSNAATTILAGLPILAVNLRDGAQIIVDCALKARGGNQLPLYSTSANGHVIALAYYNPEFQDLLLAADQIHADGMPMVLLSRLVSRRPLPERVATTDLVPVVAELAEKSGVSFYFLGGTEEVNRQSVANMKERYPNLIFAGARDGYFSRDEEPKVVAEIVALKPDIIWVGLGVPREQEFVCRNMEHFRGVGAIKTSGGLFDFLAGKNSRAPNWMQKIGLEWLYRLKLEPKRLFLRYLITNPVALWRLMFFSR